MINHPLFLYSILSLDIVAIKDLTRTQQQLLVAGLNCLYSIKVIIINVYKVIIIIILTFFFNIFAE